MIASFTNQVSGEPGAAHAVQTSATNIQSRRITAGRVPAARISTDEPIAAGRLDEDRDEQRDTDSLARRDADSKHELLGDAVEERTEGELGAAVIIGRRLVAAPAWSSQHPVEREVGGRAQAEAEGQHPRVAEARAFLREVEAHGADQGACSEGEHEPDEAIVPGSGRPEQRADDKRRGSERTPSERRGHDEDSLRRRRSDMEGSLSRSLTP